MESQFYRQASPESNVLLGRMANRRADSNAKVYANAVCQPFHVLMHSSGQTMILQPCNFSELGKRKSEKK